jgi:hypothetical protein
MDTLFEQHVTQNSALTAFAIAQAVMRFQEEVGEARGLSIFAALLIPPMVYHRRTAENLAAKNMTEGLFYRVIAEDHELVLGLQARLMTLAKHTFEAVHLGCSSRIIRLARERHTELFRVMKAMPQTVAGSEAIEPVRLVLAASKRLGYCFATTDFPAICGILRVRF